MPSEKASFQDIARSPNDTRTQCIGNFQLACTAHSNLGHRQGERYGELRHQRRLPLHRSFRHEDTYFHADMYVDNTVSDILKLDKGRTKHEVNPRTGRLSWTPHLHERPSLSASTKGGGPGCPARRLLRRMIENNVLCVFIAGEEERGSRSVHPPLRMSMRAELPQTNHSVHGTSPLRCPDKLPLANWSSQQSGPSLARGVHDRIISIG
jgi:hypothetical protein